MIRGFGSKIYLIREKILKQYEIHADKIYNKTLDTLDVVKEIEELYNELNNTFTKKEII